jgi:hypothetical protein
MSEAAQCHNGHPFEPGVTVDDAPGESHPEWCNVCGEARRADLLAVDRASKVFGWQHLSRYSGMSAEWMDATLTAIVREARVIPPG